MTGLYYRRKLALALVEAFGGRLSGTKFQKMMFLLTRKQEEKSYDFVPYKYGCFSFQSSVDKDALINKGYLSEDSNNWVIHGNRKSFLNQISSPDRDLIDHLKVKYSRVSQEEILREVYLGFPYFASRSEIAHKVLTPSELKKIESKEIPKLRKAFFTIGYEGKSVEAYINQLIQNDVKVLCDVRKNPLSRKYGFSKGQLEGLLKKFNIGYLHLPNLGIASELRQDLEDESSYKALFSQYRKTVLPKGKDDLQRLVDCSDRFQRIAITCFESDPNFCHRSCIAESMKNLLPKDFVVSNL